MAWFFGDGFDLYTALTDCGSHWDSVFGASVTLGISSSGRFAGSRALANAASSTTPYITKVSGSNDANHHFVFAVNMNNISGTTANYAFYLTLYDGSTAQCSIGVAADGSIVLKAGNISGTILATYAGAVSAINTWFAFEIEVVISNTAGSIFIRKNGNTSNDFSASSLDTQASVNAYANRIGIGSSWSTSGHLIDDFLWRSDTSSVPWVGDVRCYTRMPLADVSTQWSRNAVTTFTQTVPTVTSLQGGSNDYFTAFVAAYNGIITTTAVSISSVGTSTGIKCAIFADNGSNTGPGAVLASAIAIVAPPLAGTTTFTFTGVPVTSGVRYWVGVSANGSTLYNQGSSSSVGARAGSGYAVFPQPNPVVTQPTAPAQMSWIYDLTPGNFAAVYEPQQDAATTYVYSSTVGHADLYTIGSIPNIPSTVIGTVTRGYFQKSDAGTRNVKVQLKSGSTTVQSADATLNTTWGWVSKTDLVDPATGAAWTAAGVNNAQIGPVVTA